MSTTRAQAHMHIHINTEREWVRNRVRETASERASKRERDWETDRHRHSDTDTATQTQRHRHSDTDTATQTQTPTYTHGHAHTTTHTQTHTHTCTHARTQTHAHTHTSTSTHTYTRAHHLPRHNIRVMLHLRQNDLVTLSKTAHSPTICHEINRIGRCVHAQCGFLIHISEIFYSFVMYSCIFRNYMPRDIDEFIWVIQIHLRNMSHSHGVSCSFLSCGVATVSRIDQIIGLFYRISCLL